MDPEDRNSQHRYQAEPYQVAIESEERDIDIRHYLLTIINRIWMILTITVLAVVGTTIYSIVQTPLYRSKSVIDVSSPTMYITLPDSASSPSLYFRDDFHLNTQYRLLNGKNLAKKVREKLNLSSTDLDKGVQKKREETNEATDVKDGEEAEWALASKLLRMVRAVPIPETNLCEIIVTSPDPKLSQSIANTWAQEYVEQNLSTAQQYTRKAEELLMEQAQTLQRDVAEKEKLLHQYSLEQKIFKTDRNRSMASETLTGLSTALNSIMQERIDAEIRYQALRSSRKETIPEVLSHAIVQLKKSEYIRLQNLYAEKSKIYKPDYPEMVRLKDQVMTASAGLETALDEAYQVIVGEARSKYQQALAREATQKNQIETAKLQSVEAGNKERPYDQLLMEIENKKQLLEVLLKKQNSTDVSANVQEKTAPSTRIIEYGDLPKSVYSPNIKKNILLALLAGFLGSIVLALLLEYMDRTLKTPEDVEEHLHLPYFGLVPHYIIEPTNGKNGSSKSVARRHPGDVALDKYVPYRLSSTDSASTASEAIKTVRTSLLLSFPGGPPRSVLVTSSRAGEGKTFTACNLAIALTHLNKRVVIVDSDMRNPRIHRVWGQENNVGLSVYLTSDALPAAIVIPCPVENLYTIPSGPQTPRPAELLASARFEQLIRELENKFDFVIIDSPPILPVTDSVIIASRVKGVLLVVRGGATPRDLVKMAKKKLSASNSVIAGVVLNGIDLTDPYYYYRYYSDYYSSYRGERTASQRPD